MKASVGDRIVVASVRLDGPVRDGVVVELRHGDGSPPYFVRWSDETEPVLFFPGTDARVVHEGPTETPGAKVPAPAGGSDVRHVRSWQVRVDVFESDVETTAHAVLSSDQPTSMDARGEAHRRPGDSAVPEIGDEIAVARALRALSESLLGAAAADLTAIEGREVTLPG